MTGHRKSTKRMRGKGWFTNTPTTLDRVYCCSDKTTKDGKVKSERCVLAKDNERNCNIKLSRRYSCKIQNNGVMPIVKETIEEGDDNECKFMATGVREAVVSSAQRYRTQPPKGKASANSSPMESAEVSEMPLAEAEPIEIPLAEESPQGTKGGKTKRKRRSSRKTKSNRRQKK